MFTSRAASYRARSTFQILPVFFCGTFSISPDTNTVTFGVGQCSSDVLYHSYCGSPTEFRHQFRVLVQIRTQQEVALAYPAGHYQLCIPAACIFYDSRLCGCRFVLRHACALALHYYRSSKRVPGAGCSSQIGKLRDFIAAIFLTSSTATK